MSEKMSAEQFVVDWLLTSPNGDKSGELSAMSKALLPSLIELAEAYATEQNRLLAERVERMKEALEKIAQFAPGNGDVCEIIARTARAALAKEQG